VSDGAIVVDGYNLAIGDSLVVSFQRYPEEMFRDDVQVPRSYGALPVELSSPAHAYLPTREGEGIWLGLSPRHDHLRILADVAWLAAPEAGDVPLPWSAAVSTLEILHGLRKQNGAFCPFMRFPLARDRMPCAGVTISVRKHGNVEVRFKSPVEFEALAHEPAPRPISSDDCYGGWRLP
jgi:hypothetical protein